MPTQCGPLRGRAASSQRGSRIGRTFDGWTVAVSSFYVLLNRRANRVPSMGSGVGAEDVGHPIRSHMKTELPAALPRDAVSSKIRS